jgi:hypothetical protein
MNSISSGLCPGIYKGIKSKIHDTRLKYSDKQIKTSILEAHITRHKGDMFIATDALKFSFCN